MRLEIKIAFLDEMIRDSVRSVIRNEPLCLDPDGSISHVSRERITNELRERLAKAKTTISIVEGNDGDRALLVDNGLDDETVMIVDRSNAFRFAPSLINDKSELDAVRYDQITLAITDLPEYGTPSIFGYHPLEILARVPKTALKNERVRLQKVLDGAPPDWPRAWVYRVSIAICDYLSGACTERDAIRRSISGMSRKQLKGIIPQGDKPAWSRFFSVDLLHEEILAKSTADGFPWPPDPSEF